NANAVDLAEFSLAPASPMGWRRIFETDPACHGHGHGKLLPGMGFGLPPAKPDLSSAGSSGCDVHHKKTLGTCRELFTRNRAVEAGLEPQNGQHHRQHSDKQKHNRCDGVLYEDWKVHGASALAEMRQKNPARYCQLVAMSLPQHFKVEHEHTLMRLPLCLRPD